MMGDTNSHSSLVVDPWFLENIEVVRGPASVLYGRSSPGGIVALTSRKPSFDPGGEIKLFAGNNNQRGAAFDVTGALDDNDRVAARLSGMTRYADSQFDTLKEQRYAIMPSLTWRITDQTRLDLMAYLHRDPEGGSHSGLPMKAPWCRTTARKSLTPSSRAKMITTSTIAAKIWSATTSSICLITAGRCGRSCATCIPKSS
jgi:iron complex outermembrane receptor protein